MVFWIGSRDFKDSFWAIQTGFELCKDSFIIDIDFCGLINFTQKSVTNCSPRFDPDNWLR